MADNETFNSGILHPYKDLNAEPALSKLNNVQRFWYSRLAAAVECYNKQDFAGCVKICREEIAHNKRVPKELLPETIELLARVKGHPSRLEYAEAHAKAVRARAGQNGAKGYYPSAAVQKAADMVTEAKAEKTEKIVRPFTSNLMLRLVYGPPWTATIEEEASIQRHQMAINFYKLGNFDACKEACFENFANHQALDDVRAEACEMLASMDGVADRVGFANKWLELKKQRYEKHGVAPAQIEEYLEGHDAFVQWVKDDVAGVAQPFEDDDEE